MDRLRLLGFSILICGVAFTGSTSAPAGDGPEKGTRQAGRTAGRTAAPITPIGPTDNVLNATNPVGPDLSEIHAIVRAALNAIDTPGMTVAVVDRVGRILALYRDGAGLDGLNDDVAVGLARTAAFFSNSRAPLSSRTVRFISGKNFPNGVINTPAGPLYGIENTNRGCDLNAPFDANGNNAALQALGGTIPTSRSVLGIRNNLPCNAVDQSGCGLGIVTGKFSFVNDNAANCTDPALDLCPPVDELKDKVGPTFSDQDSRVNPGGVPIYRIQATDAEDALLGGIGVAISQAANPGLTFNQISARAEFAAFRGAFGAAVSLNAGDTAPVFTFPLPEPRNVFIEGIRLPFVNQVNQPAGTAPRAFASPLPIAAAASFAGFDPLFLPTNGRAAPIGFLVDARADPVDLVNGLTQMEVRQIVQNAVAGSNITRAQVRLPLTGFCSRMVITVTNVRGDVLAHYRMKDALYDAVDVCPAKARNAAYFSTPAGNADLAARTMQGFLPNASGTTAVSGRSIGFAGEPEYPSGIPNTPVGPFFKLFEKEVGEPANTGNNITSITRGYCQQADDMRPAPAALPGVVPRNVPLRNSVIFFPGGLPLYKGPPGNRVLVGGIGVSGDGVEQDDLVAFFGQVGFTPNGPALPPPMPPIPGVVDYSQAIADQIDVQPIDGVRVPWLKFPRNPFTCNSATADPFRAP